MSNPALGIDIGGTGIKFGLVDLEAGILMGDRIKIKTPYPSTPGAIAEVIKEVLPTLDWEGERIGVGFPAIVENGVSLTATNIEASWINCNVAQMLHEATGHQYFICNDADGAGLAERQYGSLRDVQGTAILLTLGTGIGSALFHNGVLVPNTEFGHLEYKGKLAEHWVSNRARKDRQLKYDQWARELADFLDYIILLFSPRLIVLGGGVSSKFDLYKHHFEHLRSSVVNASAFNNAGILGAALVAHPEMLTLT